MARGVRLITAAILLALLVVSPIIPIQAHNPTSSPTLTLISPSCTDTATILSQLNQIHAHNIAKIINCTVVNNSWLRLILEFNPEPLGTSGGGGSGTGFRLIPKAQAISGNGTGATAIEWLGNAYNDTKLFATLSGPALSGIQYTPNGGNQMLCPYKITDTSKPYTDPWKQTTWTCLSTNPGTGTVTNRAWLNVGINPVINSFTSNKTQFSSGEQATLTYSTSYASSVKIQTNC